MNKTLTMDHQKLHDLIALVQGYPCLYDAAQPGYKKTKKNGVIWLSIAQQLSEEVEVCKSKWRYLRDEFVKRLNKSVGFSGQSPIESLDVWTWPFFKPLLFLKETRKPRETSGNFVPDCTVEISLNSDKEDSDDGLNSTLASSSSSTLPRQDPTIQELMKNSKAMAADMSSEFEVQEITRQTKVLSPQPKIVVVRQNNPVKYINAAKQPLISATPQSSPVLSPVPKKENPVRLPLQPKELPPNSKSGNMSMIEGQGRTVQNPPSLWEGAKKRRKLGNSVPSVGKDASDTMESAKNEEKLLNAVFENMNDLKKEERRTPNMSFFEALAHDVDKLPTLRQAYLKMKFQAMVFEELHAVEGQ